MSLQFLKEISGVPGSGACKAEFTSGAISTDLRCAQFFMTMQDRKSTLDDVDAYAAIGHMIQPDVDWKEIKRVAESFRKSSTKSGSKRKSRPE